MPDAYRTKPEAGLLRLTTTERLARHMGNVIDDKLEAELETLL